jgi:hypothetical protein
LVEIYHQAKAKVGLYIYFEHKYIYLNVFYFL